MIDIKHKIDELLFERCSKQERDILIYLKQNLTQIPTTSISYVADNNFCSTTSVTRIIKKLGFNNYKELQYAIKVSKQIQTNKNLDSQLKHNDFINALLNQKCLYIYGKGASQITAHYLFRQLLKLDFDVSLINEQDLLYTLQNRTVIIISNSGKTSSVIEMANDITKINSCNVLAITKLNSELDKLATHSLTYNHPIANRDAQIILMKQVEHLILQIKQNIIK